jgi:hypothetical protein
MQERSAPETLNDSYMLATDDAPGLAQGQQERLEQQREPAAMPAPSHAGGGGGPGGGRA